MTATPDAQPVDCAAFRATYPEAAHVTDAEIEAHMDLRAIRLDEKLTWIEQGVELDAEPVAETAA
jgi:hypothetical protein